MSPLELFLFSLASLHFERRRPTEEEKEEEGKSFSALEEEDLKEEARESTIICILL